MEKAVPKLRKKSKSANHQVVAATRTRLAHKKRPRAVLSDDDEGAESDSPTRAPAPAPAPSTAVKKRDRDGDKEPRERERKREKEKEKPKKARAKAKAKAKDAQADLELENEPLHPPLLHIHTHASTSNPHTKQPAKSSSSLSGAPPKSATNIARPELPLPSSPLDASVSKPPRLAQLAQDPDSDRASAADAPSTKPKLSAPALLPSPSKSKAPPRDHPDAEEIEAEADALVAAFDLPLPAAELEGMLIETLATARASSLASSALYGALMAARPALREMRLPALRLVDKAESDDAPAEDANAGANTKSRGRGGAKADTASRRAWVPALEAVLEAGWRRSGVFGKIVNSGTVRLSPSPFVTFLSLCEHSG